MQVATIDVWLRPSCHSLIQLKSLFTATVICARENHFLPPTSFFFSFYLPLSAATRRRGRCGAWPRTTRRTRRCSRRSSGPAAPAEPIAERSREEDPASTLPTCRIRRRTLSMITSGNTLSPRRIVTSATMPPSPPWTPVLSHIHPFFPFSPSLLQFQKFLIFFLF